MKNDNVKSFTVLVAICVVVAALMGIVNSITSPRIEKIEAQKVQDAMLVVLPSGEKFTKLNIESSDNSVQEIYTEANGGYVFKISATGYASGMIILCGIDANGVVTGTTCIKSSETLEKEKTYGENFIGKDINNVDSVDTVTGATLTTSAYKTAIKTALDMFELLTESEVQND